MCIKNYGVMYGRGITFFGAALEWVPLLVFC